MKICPRCGCTVEDDAAFCYNCGSPLQPTEGVPQGSASSEQAEGNTIPVKQPAGNQSNSVPPVQQEPPYGEYNGYQTQPNYQQGYYPPPYDRYDHTSEFDPQDIAQNKVLAMVPYLLGALGIIVALLAMQSSEYVSFHVKQALKLTVVDVLVGLVSLLLCWTFIIPIAGLICALIVAVLRIIAFFQVCYGKAKEPAIIRSLGFLH